MQEKKTYFFLSALIIIRYLTMQERKTYLSLFCDYLLISNDAGEEKQIQDSKENPFYLSDKMFSLAYIYESSLLQENIV